MGITAVILETLFVNVGLGRHIYCLPASALPLVFKYSILAQIFNIAGIGLVKISVCLHILRIVDRARRYISIFLQLLILVTFLSHLAQILLFCVQCRPMAAIWDPQQYPDAKCFSSHITYLAGYIGFGLDAFTDLVTAIIPIVVIRALQMNTRTKVALCILMGLGILTAVCAVAKAITLQGVFAADYTWALWRPGLCTIIEHLMGMIIASAPALNPLFKRALRTPTSLYGSSHSQRSDREEKREAGLQGRRVTRWADARTPPNVHIGHYSPYSNERTKQRTHSDEMALNSHHPKLHPNTHHPKLPSTATTSSSYSDSTALDSSLTILGTDRRNNEITKTISFHRISQHERVNPETDASGMGSSAHDIDHDNNYNNNTNRADPIPGVLTPPPAITDRLARASNGELIPDRLWMGNGYWGLPAAPIITTTTTATTNTAGPPSTTTAQTPKKFAEGQKQEMSYSTSMTTTPPSLTAREAERGGEGDEPSLMSLPPHPAVGRWVATGGERPLAREEGGRAEGGSTLPRDTGFIRVRAVVEKKQKKEKNDEEGEEEEMADARG